MLRLPSAVFRALQHHVPSKPAQTFREDSLSRAAPLRLQASTYVFGPTSFQDPEADLQSVAAAGETSASAAALQAAVSAADTAKDALLTDPTAAG